MQQSLAAEPCSRPLQQPVAITINASQLHARLETPQKTCTHSYTGTLHSCTKPLLTSMLVRVLVVLMASFRLAVDTRLTGLPLPFPRGDSKPESMLDSELLELRLRVSGSSMAAL